MEIAAFSFDRHVSSAVDSLTGSSVDTEKLASTYGGIELRAGILRTLEIQGTFDGYSQIQSRQQTAGISTSTTTSGNGNSGLRLKCNIFGNEKGKSLGLISAIKLPGVTSAIASRKVQYEFELPFNYEIVHNFSAAIMPAYSRNGNDDGVSNHNEFEGAFLLGWNTTANLNSYIQFVSISSDQTGATIANSAGLGLAFKAADNLQIDAGANWGLTLGADTFLITTGLTFGI